MTTSNKFANLVEKRLLGLVTLKDYVLDFMRMQFSELVQRTWDLDGTLGSSKVDITGSGNDEFDLDTDATGTDGAGHFLVTGSEYETNVPFENANSIPYDIGLHYAEKPSGVIINQRLGMPQYDTWEEVIGVRADPDSVTEVSGTVRAVVDSVFEASVSNAGRKCLIFMKVPAEGATTEVVAVEECTVQWDSSNNYIVTSGALGQSTISTTASDYSVIALGPAVRRNTDLEAASGYWYIGEVTGAGAGNPPTVFDTTDQRLIEKSLSTLLENLVYADADNVFTGENTFENDTTFESDTYLESDNNVTGELNLGPTSHVAFESPTDWFYQRIYFNVDCETDFPSSKVQFLKLCDNAVGNSGDIHLYVSKDGIVLTRGAYWNSSNYWAFDSGVTSALAFRMESNKISCQYYGGADAWGDDEWEDWLCLDDTGPIALAALDDLSVVGFPGSGRYYGNIASNSKICLIGNDTLDDDFCAYSRDCKNWSNVGIGTYGSQVYFALSETHAIAAYGAEGGGGGNIMYTTTPPTGWIYNNMGAGSVARFAYYANGYFVFGGVGGAFYYATDPAGSWTSNSPGSEELRDCFYDPVSNQWGVVGADGKIYYQTGAGPTGSWSSVDTGSEDWRTVCKGIVKNTALWVVGGTSDDLRTAPSLSGPWTARSHAGDSGTTIYKAIFVRGWFYAACYNTTIAGKGLQKSKNGIDWEIVPWDQSLRDLHCFQRRLIGLGLTGTDLVVSAKHGNF
jgi:hypothetical protein